MKNMKWMVNDLVIVVAMVVGIELHAQTTMTDTSSDSAAIQSEPITLNTTDMAAVQTLSEAQLAAFVSALDATPQIAYKHIGSMPGTFYSLQNPSWPPLPTDTSGSAVWQMNGFFLLNDVYFDYSAAASQSTTTTSTTTSLMTMDATTTDSPPVPGDGTGSTNVYTLNGLVPPDYGTNLWIAQVSIENGYFTAIASNTVANVQYEVQTNADLTTTNWGTFGFPVYGSVTTNWTPLDAVAVSLDITNLFFRLRSWASSDGSGLPDWWEQANDVTDPYGDPDGDGWNNLQEFQNGTDPNTFNTPAAPQGLVVNLHQTANTASLNWQPSAGIVVNYTVEKTYQLVYEPPQTNASVISTSAYTDSLTGNSPDPWYGNMYRVSYRIKANYSNGQNSPWSPSVALQPPTVSGVITPSADGGADLVVSGVPANATVVRLFFADQSAIDNQDNSFNYSEDIPVSSLTNNIFRMPASWKPPQTDAYGLAFYGIYIKSVDADGNASGANECANDFSFADPAFSWGTTFYDGRTQLKQNLIFQLRAAPLNASLHFAIPPTNPAGSGGLDSGSFGAYVGDYVYPTNYACSGYGDSGTGFRWPFIENCLYRNFVFSGADIDTNGSLATGLVADADPNYFSGENIFLVRPFKYQCQADWTTFPALLDANETRWMYYDDGTGLGNPLYAGLVNLDYDAETLTMSANLYNWFGLPYISAMVAYKDYNDPNTPLLTNVVSAGATLNFAGYNAYGVDGRNIYPETAQPVFKTEKYCFYQPRSDALPGSSAFSITDGRSYVLAPAGGMTQIAGYAKLEVTNSIYTGVYGFLGQYFDQAYKIDADGNVTTNTTGIVTPYGNYFANEAGEAALVTMPDPDTGERGTCTVYAVSLQLDKNHDGVMDLEFNGSDATSESSPFVFWANNNFDRWHTVDGNDAEQDDLSQADIANLDVPAEQKVPDCQYVTNGYPAIPCTRDLEDYFRLWLPGVASAMEAVPSNYTVQLTLTGDAQIRIFQAIEADGGTNYLFDETTASNQVADSPSLYVGLLTSNSPIVFNVTTNFNEHFIFCGAQTGTAQVDLQVLDGNQNIVADSPAYLEIKDIKQMYERWTVGDNPNVLPMATPTNAVEDLPPFTPAFQYTQPTDTNTPYILLVHGWNMERWEKDRFAEAAYKRLYWQGYQGRFGLFRWPTDHDFGGVGDSWNNPITDPRNYDNSEFQAWQSATGLTNLLIRLNAEYPNHVYLMAHSMGNVVAGEALRKLGASIVNTYVAMQAAVPSHAYDSTTPSRSLVYYGVDLDDGTPNRYANYYTNGAPCYFNSSSGAKNYVNFFNPNDYALSLSLWQLNQDLKPDNGAPYPGYHYSTSSGFYKITGSGTNNIHYLNFPGDTYEIFSYCDEARCYALGAQIDTGGAFKVGSTYNEVELDALPFNFGSEHKYHSGEFRSDNMQRAVFWNKVLVEMKLEN